MNPIPESLKELLDGYGAEVTGSRPIDHGTQYDLARGLENVKLNVYRTGKISVGGKGSRLKDLIEGWRVARTESGAVRSGGVVPRVGTDEAGKGDYFGPLVVAGVRCPDERAERKLLQIGVRDSKTLSATNVQRLAELIPEAVGENDMRVLSLSPKEYEACRKTASNVNRLLGELNAEILGELKSEVKAIVVDEFAASARGYLEPFVPEEVRLEVRARAEDDVAVAAASVLARARYLEELGRLSGRLGFELPRGATHVLEAARRVVEERGVEGLAEVAKVSFATTRSVIGASGQELERK